MGRRRNFAPMPTKEELEDLYLPDRQNKRQIELAGHYGVSRDTIKDWLSFHGIEKRAQQRELADSKPARQAKRARDPKRNMWLDEEGEAPPLRPDVAVKPTRRQSFVISEARQKSAPAPIGPAPVTADEAAPLLRKARELPPEKLHAIKAAIARVVEYKYTGWLL